MYVRMRVESVCVEDTAVAVAVDDEGVLDWVTGTIVRVTSLTKRSLCKVSAKSRSQPFFFLNNNDERKQNTGEKNSSGLIGLLKRNCLERCKRLFFYDRENARKLPENRSRCGPRNSPSYALTTFPIKNKTRRLHGRRNPESERAYVYACVYTGMSVGMSSEGHLPLRGSWTRGA